ncbi:MAG: cupin domain-containing protein [Gemmatimonadales bacterium]
MLAPRPWDPRLGPLQLATLRRTLEREGMVTAWWSDVPGTYVPLHAHAFAETRWVVEGFVRVIAGSDTFDLGPGDRLDLPPHTPHATEVIGLAQAIYVTGMPKGATPTTSP